MNFQTSFLVLVLAFALHKPADQIVWAVVMYCCQSLNLYLLIRLQTDGWMATAPLQIPHRIATYQRKRWRY
jgi:hypothetical protein